MKTLMLIVYLTNTSTAPPSMTSQVSSWDECIAVKKALEFSGSPYRVRCTLMRP